MTASEVGAVPDDVIEEVATDDGYIVDLVSLIHEHCGGTDDSDEEHRHWVLSLATACARLASRDVLSVPALAEVIARDAKVREIVAETMAGDPDHADTPVSYVYADGFDEIAALYPTPGDRDDSGEQRRPADAMPHIAYTYRVRPLFGGAVCLGCEQVVDVGDDAIQWTDDAITHKFCPRPPIVEIEEQK